MSELVRNDVEWLREEFGFTGENGGTEVALAVLDVLDRLEACEAALVRVLALAQAWESDSGPLHSWAAASRLRCAISTGIREGDDE